MKNLKKYISYGYEYSQLRGYSLTVEDIKIILIDNVMLCLHYNRLDIERIIDKAIYDRNNADSVESKSESILDLLKEHGLSNEKENDYVFIPELEPDYDNEFVPEEELDYEGEFVLESEYNYEEEFIPEEEFEEEDEFMFEEEESDYETYEEYEYEYECI